MSAHLTLISLGEPMAAHVHARRPLAWRIHAGTGTPCLTAIAYGRSDAEQVGAQAYGPTAPIQTTLRRHITPVRLVTPSTSITQETVMPPPEMPDVPHPSLLDLRRRRVVEHVQTPAPLRLLTEQDLEDANQRGYTLGVQEGRKAERLAAHLTTLINGRPEWLATGIVLGFIAAALLFGAYPELLASR